MSEPKSQRIPRQPLSSVARRRREADDELFVPGNKREPENPGSQEPKNLGSQIPENPSTPVPQNSKRPATRAERGVLARKYSLPAEQVENVDKLHAALFMTRPGAKDTIEKSDIVATALERAFTDPDGFREAILQRHQRKHPKPQEPENPST